MSPPMAPTSSNLAATEKEITMANVATTTIVEWPREKNRPTVTGSLPIETRLRVTERQLRGNQSSASALSAVRRSPPSIAMM